MKHFDELLKLLDSAYAPYSDFHVASIVVTRDGRIFKGVNVESVAYSTTLCAERNAIFSAVTEGVKPGDITEVHILARNAKNDLFPAYPCGSCRQIIAEQSLNKATVYVYRSKTDISQHSIAELLPYAFSSLTDTL
jgi:cytidine deaminase